MENVVGAWHRAAATFKTADVADVEFDFVCDIGIFRLILVTHIILFFSSREKMRISAMSVLRKRLSTAFPKLPVPPVIIKVFPAKILISFL